MDLEEEERSTSKSVEEDEVILSSILESPLTVEKPIKDEIFLAEENEFSRNSSQSPPSDSAAKKGNGLRKWRRIKRDLRRSRSGVADAAQILKRRLPIADSSNAADGGENKMKIKAEAEGEDSVESRNADVNSHQVGGFSIGVDSDNSEDRSSKSSTATSAPRPRHEVVASGKERGRLKNFGGKGFPRLSVQKVQQGRGGKVDAGKTGKGDLARFEKENSLSSVESDLRSSVVGVVLGGSNGKHNGRFLNFDERSDEGQEGEEVRSGYYKENGKAENLCREDLDAEVLEEDDGNNEIFQSSCDLDPFFETMGFLQEAQEALEKEIEKIVAIGKEYDENDRQFEGMVAYNSQMLDAFLVDLRKKAENLESKLEEASTVIETKDQKLRELEALLGETQLPSSHVLPFQAHEEELGSELEVLLKEKMEAEIEYLIITRTTQNWKILFEDHIALNEQRYLAGDHEQMMLKLRDAEDKFRMLNDQKDKLEVCCKELVGTGNALRMQNKVCKFSLCVVVQLMLLSIAFWLFLMQLSPVDGVVPT